MKPVYHFEMNRSRATYKQAWFNPYAKRKPKYGNEHTKTGGRTYDSNMEATYSQQLEWRKKAGEIVDYTPQFQLGIYISGEKWNTWKVDFMVEMKDGSMELHEVKGMETREYLMKRDAFLLCLKSEHEGNYVTNYRNGEKLDRHTELIVIKQSSKGWIKKQMN